MPNLKSMLNRSRLSLTDAPLLQGIVSFASQHLHRDRVFSIFPLTHIILDIIREKTQHQKSKLNLYIFLILVLDLTVNDSSLHVIPEKKNNNK